MTTLNDRYEAGQNMRGVMSGGDRTHYALPGVDQLAPDLKRIIDEALFGLIWTRPGLDLRHRCIATVSALMALGDLNLLRRHLDRSLNVGLTPNQVVEIFIQSTFYVGVPAVETALRLTKDIFEERASISRRRRNTTPRGTSMSCTPWARSFTATTWVT